MIVRAGSLARQAFIAALTIPISSEIEGRSGDTKAPARSSHVADRFSVFNDPLLALAFSLILGDLDPPRNVASRS